MFNILTAVFSVFSLLMLIPFLHLIFQSNTTESITMPILEQSESFKMYISNAVTYQIQAWINYNGKAYALLWVCCITLLVFLLKNIFRYLALHFLAPMRTGIAYNIRNKIYNKILSLDIAYFADEQQGKIMTKMTNDVQEIEYGVLHFLEIIFKEPITILITLVTMLIMSPQLTLFVLIILPLSGYVIGRIGKSLKQSSHIVLDLQSQLNQITNETLNGIKVIKAYNATSFFRKLFYQTNEAHHQISTKMLRKRDLSSPLSEFLGIGVVVIVLYVGGRLVLNETSSLSAEAFIAFIVIFSQIIQPAKAFANAYYFIQKGLASMDRVNQLLQEKIQIENSKDAIVLSEIHNNIEIKNINFKYNNKTVLNNVSFSIPKNKKIAIVGLSGSGKTTLVQLLLRFYDVQSGNINIDGTDIKHIKIEDLRQQFSLVTQHAVLFNDTIKNNIILNNDLDEQKLNQVIDLCNLGSIIDHAENGLCTFIGDNGIKLSGGEQQRLALARAVYHDAPILILDEATAHLDSSNEQIIQQALAKYWQNKTAVVIAHRLSTIQQCDNIIVMKTGTIVEQGNHQSLMEAKGEYFRLVSLQQL